MGAGEGEAAGSKDKSAATGGGGAVARTSLDGLRDKNVMQLKKLNTALFPVRYNDKYYQDAIASKDFSKLGEQPTPTPTRLFPISFESLPTSRRRVQFAASSGRFLYRDCICFSYWICRQKAGND
jgi:hypothetical protein